MRYLALLTLCACRLHDTFECGVDEVCRDGEELGVCEVEGYCSFGDSDCTSGRRFADNAGNDLAGTCVGETAEPLTCLDLWRTNTVRFGAVTELTINAPEDDRDPWLAPSGNFIYFSSNRGGTFDIYGATRADTTVDFGALGMQANLSSAQSDVHISISTDQLTLYMTSNRTGTKGGMDVWRSTRTALSLPFATPDAATLDAVNTAANEHDATLSTDSLRLYLATDQGSARQRIAIASRPTPSDAFGVPAPIVELDVGDANADPTPSRDELLLVFASLAATDIGGGNLWYSTRASTTEKWSPARLVPDVNISGDEGDPFLSPDGCVLYFSRSLAPAGPRDIVFASVVH